MIHPFSHFTASVNSQSSQNILDFADPLMPYFAFAGRASACAAMQQFAPGVL